jgi:3-oxoacyl-[acyl-carrier protein] reductase
VTPDVQPVAVITGAAGGIGSAICRLLVQRGATVCAVDIDVAKLDALTASLKGMPFFPFVCDVSDEEQVISTLGQIQSRCGAPDLLVNNAGILKDGVLISLRPDGLYKLPTNHWKSVLETNLTGTFLVTREAVASMLQSGKRGLIINMSSIARTGNAGQSSYAASKAGIAALVKTWAQELAFCGIRVVGIAPGLIDTPMIEAIPSSTLRLQMKRIPARRLGKPEEIAAAVGFILDDGYVNGRIFDIDGGFEF